jgi:hypothetical protein
MRSAEMLSSQRAFSRIASSRSGVVAKGLSAFERVVSKRTALSILKGSSRIRSRGSPTGRITPDARSFLPSNGSMTLPVRASAAIALIVKSRRARSSSRLSPKLTSGCLLPGYTGRCGKS